MSPKSISGKATRTYQSALRRQQAEATRNRILQAAAELFAADGYARTTFASIASAAGVSAETVQGQGPKAALLIAAIEFAAFGVVGEDNVLNLDVAHTLMAIDDPGQALDYLAAVQTDVHGRTARLYVALFSGADSDAKLAQYLGELLTSITAEAHRLLEVFRERGWVRHDVELDELAETSAVLCSVEIYLRMTTHHARTVTDYQRWLRRMLAETVFAVPQGN